MYVYCYACVERWCPRKTIVYIPDDFDFNDERFKYAGNNSYVWRIDNRRSITVYFMKYNRYPSVSGTGIDFLERWIDDTARWLMGVGDNLYPSSWKWE